MPIGPVRIVSFNSPKRPIFVLGFTAACAAYVGGFGGGGGGNGGAIGLGLNILHLRTGGLWRVTFPFNHTMHQREHSSGFAFLLFYQNIFRTDFLAYKVKHFVKLDL